MIRVLTKFQVNLVIPKNNTYGYISTKRRGYVFMGFFIIFLVWGGKSHGIYIIKVGVNMKFEEKALSMEKLRL